MQIDMDPDEDRKARNRIANILKAAVSLAGILILVLTQDLKAASQLLRDQDWRPFLLALLLLILGSFVRAYRWGSLLWALGAQASFGRLVRLYFVGAFFNLFLPTGVGGDAVKMYELSRDAGKAAPAISSVIMDRFLGLFVLFALALLAVVGSPQLAAPEIRLVISGVFLILLLGVGLLLQRTWIEAWGRRLGLDRLLGRFQILSELYGSIHLYGPAALLRASAASLVWNLILILSYYLLGLAVGINLTLGSYFLLVPVISALLVVPSVGGLGIREGGTVFLFRQLGAPEAQALALAFSFDLTLVITGLIGATIYLVQSIQEARS
jgi:uncharacterized protein (TIRG00374 family)